MDRWKLLLCVVVIVASIASIFVFWDSSPPTLRSKNDYLFDISAGSTSDIARPIYCTVIKNQETIFPSLMIGTTMLNLGALEFTLLEDKNDGLVAIIEKANPQVILALYDLKNRKSWPSSDPKVGWREEYAIGQKLLHRWNKNRPGQPFVLSGSVRGDVTLKVR